MTKEEVIEVFNQKRFMLDMGAFKIANQLKTDVDIIREARAIVRKSLKEGCSVSSSKDQIFKQDNQKILFLDIETAPLRAFVWSRWKQNVGLSQTISE